MGSAAESEIGPNYINSQYAVPLQTCLINMGHPQPSTKLQIYNIDAEAFSKITIKQKISKAIDMRFYCLQDRKTQGQFKIFWCPRKDNLGDNQKKHHSPC